MHRSILRVLVCGVALSCFSGVIVAADSVPVWPGLAPREISGEASDSVGVPRLPSSGIDDGVTRLHNVRRPTVDVFLADKPNGTAVVVLPGGGFMKVVPDKEGSEVAPLLNRLGISVFVLRYRTNEVTPKDEPAWLRPLQDAQRTIRMIRSRAQQYQVDPDRVGQLSFSAGGQVGAVWMTASGNAAYPSIDIIDEQDCRPDFSMLIYPWNLVRKGSDQGESLGRLIVPIQPNKDCRPTFIVHTHDDNSTSIGSVLLYAGLKRHGVPAELHVYQNGGHGYGARQVPNSDIGTWPERATDWLRLRGLAEPQP
ncbi:Acetylxylan esterase precursor [Rubripirellula lacrimiformis]|uniref:Acetylxylan esterase n=1 Tax=Rubripirellula lacrimiformis TaxID=1930273 RepID=A0A517NCU6_9BACT|nr:alpha/beta hydrolase [Rubripirellula lacrimiformis]QDT04931.1 Acetylxylan esterase precursor [Rubripirellula lacrimiformis]